MKNHKFIKYLNASNNPKIKDVSWLKNLKKLGASGDCGINQLGINGLDLIKLDASNNPKIKNVSWMKNLKKLGASGDCGINQLGIN